MKKPKVYSPRHRREQGGKVFDPKKWGNLYDRDWERYRLKYLEINQRCYSCGVKSTVVDHLVPHQGDEKLFRKLDNHIPLCTTCHNKVTALFDRRYRAGNPVENKISWLSANRGQRDLTFRVKVLGEYP